MINRETGGYSKREIERDIDRWRQMMKTDGGRWRNMETWRQMETGGDS